MEGILLKNIIAKNNTTNLQGVICSAGVSKLGNGSQAPIYTKQAQFSMRSITEAKLSSSVW